MYKTRLAEGSRCSSLGLSFSRLPPVFWVDLFQCCAVVWCALLKQLLLRGHLVLEDRLTLVNVTFFMTV